MSNLVKVISVLDDSIVNDIPLIEVFVGSVTQPKNISKVILELNSLCPIPQLNHLKRVRAKKALLFPSEGIEDKEVHTILKKKGFQLDLFQNEVERIKVPRSSPLVKQQYLKCHAIWPCNFHPDRYLEKLFTNTLFEDEQLKRIKVYMEMAVEISESSCNSSGVVVVDPKRNSVVAVGYDDTSEGPLRHAIMVAIDNVAKSQIGGAWKTSGDSCVPEDSDFSLKGIPEKILRNLSEKHRDVKFGASIFTPKNGDPEGPYLCTGYEIYSVLEPCVMCAMGLIHSRANRVYYKVPTTNGALGSLCKVHTIKDLNHHYEVFIVQYENSKQEGIAGS